MTTSEITAGVPTAEELEILANLLFPDFDAQRCADGIEKNCCQWRHKCD